MGDSIIFLFLFTTFSFIVAKLDRQAIRNQLVSQYCRDLVFLQLKSCANAVRSFQVQTQILNLNLSLNLNFRGTSFARSSHYLLIPCLLLLSTTLFAQYPGSGNSSYPTNGGYGNQGNSRPQARQETAPDTLSKEVYFYFADNDAEKFQFQDSSMINFHLYDPVRQATYEYAHLGNLGSAHRQLVYQPQFRKGFDVGFHNYDLYLTKPEDIPYYQLEKAYSDIYFSQTSQEKTAFSARFSKPIGKDINLALDYKNIRNEGQYTNQAARTNAFTVNSNFKSKSQKYRAYLSITANTVEQRENGGGNVEDTLTFRKGILPIGRAVNTTTGEARYFQRDINLTHFYLLQKKSKLPDQIDSMLTKSATSIPRDAKQPNASYQQQLSSLSQAPATGRKYTLKHNLILRRNTYKYVDIGSLDYYGNFVLDDRGVRNFIESNQIENTFSIRTFRLEKEPTLSYAADWESEQETTQKDLIELGLTHTFTDLRQEPLDSTVNNLFLFGKISFTPSDRLKIYTYGHFGILDQAGDYRLKGDFLFDTKKLGRINVSLTNQRYAPNLLQRQFWVTQQAIWRNDFNKTFETSLSVSYSLPKLKIDLEGHYHLIDNYIYYDQTAQPQQLASSLNIFQLIVRNKIDLGRLHLENTAYFQRGGSDVLRFPEIYGIHRLYLDLKLFKVMKTQLGTDVRWNTTYRPDNFQPLTAQFFLQDSYQTQFYPTVDVFLNFRIQQFRFFFIYENLYDFFTTDFNYFTFPYPQFDAQARFGFRWLFLD